MPAITPSLWFYGNIEEAMDFYTNVFPDSSIDKVVRMPGGGGPIPQGSVLSAHFTLGGLAFLGVNGGPAEFRPTEAVSFTVACKDQDEVDYYWGALTDGGEESQCGWLKDRYGLSWQIVPGRLHELIQDADPARAAGAMQAMMTMHKIVIADLEAGADAAS